MRMIKLAFVTLLLMPPAAIGQPAKADEPRAGQNAAGKISEMSAEEFIRQTTAANQFEIDASKLAVQQAKTKEVKDLAEALVSDHTAVAEKLRAAVQKDGKLEPPKHENTSAKYPQTLEQLKGAFGDAFDRAYLQAMFTGHAEALDRYKNYAETGGDARLRKVAEEIVPVVEQHLTRVRGMLGP